MASAIIAMGAYLGLAPIITAVAEDGTSTNGIASSVFGATGLFVGMLVGIAVGEISHVWLNKKPSSLPCLMVFHQLLQQLSPICCLPSSLFSLFVVSASISKNLLR